MEIGTDNKTRNQTNKIRGYDTEWKMNSKASTMKLRETREINATSIKKEQYK